MGGAVYAEAKTAARVAVMRRRLPQRAWRRAPVPLFGGPASPMPVFSLRVWPQQPAETRHKAKEGRGLLRSPLYSRQALLPASQLCPFSTNKITGQTATCSWRRVEWRTCAEWFTCNVARRWPHACPRLKTRCRPPPEHSHLPQPARERSWCLPRRPPRCGDRVSSREGF